MPQSLRLFRCSELRAACDEFSPEARLGKGRFGEVFKGILDREVVAVKRMHIQGTAVLFQELKVLSCVRHQNVLPLIGFSADFDGQCLVVYPFMQTGSLSDLLQDSGRPRISSMQRVLIGTNSIFIYAPQLARRLDGGTHVMALFSLAAAGVCRGLLALHRRQLIHGNVKSRNILLDSSLNAKLCGLGSVTELMPNGSMTTNMTSSFVDAECLRQGILCAKSDVFSMGVVLLELLCGHEVLANGPELPQLQNGDWQKIADPALPWTDVIGSTLGELVVSCLKQELAARPGSLELVEELQKLEWAAGFQASFSIASAAARLGEQEVGLQGEINLCECVVCMEALPNARLRTCGHAVTCAECVAMLVDQGFGCPVCRRSIEAGDWDVGHFYPTFSRRPDDSEGARSDDSDLKKSSAGPASGSQSVHTGLPPSPRKPSSSLVGLLPSLLELMTLDSQQLDSLPFRAALDLGASAATMSSSSPSHDGTPSVDEPPTTDEACTSSTGCCHEQVDFTNLKFVWQCLLETCKDSSGCGAGCGGGAGIGSNLVPRLVDIVRYSTEPKLQTFAAWTLLRLLPSLIDEVVDCDAASLFSQLLSASDHEVQLVACWLLEAIAETPTVKQSIVECGGIVLLAGLLKSPSAALQESAVGALMNLAVDGEAYFGDIIAHAIDTVIHLLGIGGTPQVRAKSAAFLRRLSLPDLPWRKKLCEHGAVPSLEALIDDLSATTQEGRIEAASALLNLTEDEPSAATSCTSGLSTSSACLQPSTRSFARPFHFLVGILLFVALCVGFGLHRLQHEHSQQVTLLTSMHEENLQRFKEQVLVLEAERQLWLSGHCVAHET